MSKCGCSAHAYNWGPSRGRSPICPESGTIPRPRPRFAEIGDQAGVLCHGQSPQRGRGFAPRFGPVSPNWSESPFEEGAPAMADDVVDYSSTSDSGSESDKVPSTVVLAGSQFQRDRACTLRIHGLSVLLWHAGCGCAPSPEKKSIARPPSVARFPATLPRASGGSSASFSSASSSDQDAGKPMAHPQLFERAAPPAEPQCAADHASGDDVASS